MYLVRMTRPDIVFIVGLLSKHNANHRQGHLRASNIVVKYLKKTIQIGLIFGPANATRRLPQDPAPSDPIGYVDINFAGDSEDCKSVKGYYFFLNSAVVLWNSRK